MIPVRLRLRNFMSYGENVEPLDFTGIRLACLCGDNGHGKSALLDAITWALWGRARISDRRDASEDELIHLGRTEMEVEFEFELDGNRYAVLRKRAVRVTATRKTSTGTLELQIADGDAYRPITGDSMRATQQKISEILRLDYITFVNSAFILQGRADEFTRKTATERKRILSDLLGLGYYDTLEERARELTRQYEQERREHALAIEEIDRELAAEPQHSRELARLTQLVDELVAEADVQDHEVARLREQLRELELKAAQRTEAQGRVGRAEASLRSLRTQRSQAESRLREHEKLVEQREAIRRGHAELLEARKAVAELDVRFGRLHDLTKRQAEVDAAIARARGEVESALRVQTSEAARLKKELAREPSLRKQEADLREQIVAMADLPAERDACVQEAEASRVQIETLKAVNVQLKGDMATLKERLDVLAKSGASCPICGGTLDAAGRERLNAQFKAEGSRMATDYRTNATRMAELEGTIATARKRATEIDESLRRRQGLERSHANVEQALQQVERCREELAGVEDRQYQLSARLAAADYAQTEQAEKQRLDAEIAGLEYDAAHHQRLRARGEELARYEGLLVKLEAAEAAVPREREELEALARLEQDAAAAIQDDVARVAQLDADLAKRPGVERALASARQVLDETIRRQARTREARGEVQQRLNHCQYLRGERATRADAQSRAAHEKGLYEELAIAFGKKGIQAMIIESAIPEIEREANDVLARMTDGRLNVKLETQRDTHAGDGTIETLDIKTADELGVRSLELYSGGEAFRVNFAVRIALSKLLTRRAGARVQTLVIDEGFGSQDSFGRQRLIEAINAVANDFEKIIVITHIDELKDAFPTRIDVVKGAEGSRLTVT